MKKLLLLATLCIATSSQALDKHGLETAIRSLDVTSVKQIIENEKLTVREYNRYLDLAEEVVRSRELWILKRECYYDDITTPSTLSGWQLAAQLLAGGILIVRADPESKGVYGPIMFFSGTALLLKCCTDLILDVKKQKKIFRKKYDDAVTIKQLIYTADLVEA
jgi:hypothetical protein